MAHLYSCILLLVLGVAQAADNIDHVQIVIKAVPNSSNKSQAMDRAAAFMSKEHQKLAACEVTVYEHWAPGVAGKEDYQGDSKTFQGTGKNPFGAYQAGTSSVKVSGRGCVAYGYTSEDCSGEKNGNAISSSTEVNGLPAGTVSSSDELVKYWVCDNCIRCVEVTQEDPTAAQTEATAAPTAAPTEATPAPTAAPTAAPTHLPPQETPQCDGCGPNAMECWTKCSDTAGLCDTCNSVQGTKGACCRVDESADGVRTRPDGDNPQVCADIPAERFQQTNYHTCILTLESPHEIPKCTGCGNRNMECWDACDQKQGYCDACNSAQGTKGACCRVDADGGHFANSPAECSAVPTSGFAYKDYHMCVLEMEITKCTGCTGRALECWSTCAQKSGACAACDGSDGTPGACCRVDNGEHVTWTTDDCKAIHVSKFSYWGYNTCVLANSPAVF